MAERGGFEPPVVISHTWFRVRHLRPLGHLSAVCFCTGITMPAKLLYTKLRKNESIFIVIGHLVLVVSNFLREFFVKVLLIQCDLAVIVDLLQPLVHQKGICYILKTAYRNSSQISFYKGFLYRCLTTFIAFDYGRLKGNPFQFRHTKTHISCCSWKRTIIVPRSIALAILITGISFSLY